MSKDPAALFYIDTWLTATAEMDSDVRGWYLNLVLHQFDKKSLPNDSEKLAVLAGVKFSEYDRFKQMLEQVLKQKFKLNDEGRLENDYAKTIIQRREVFKDKRSKSGNIGVVIKLIKEIQSIDNDKLNYIKKHLFDLETSELEKLKDKQVLKQMLEQVLKLYINENKNENINEVNGIGGTGGKGGNGTQFFLADDVKADSGQINLLHGDKSVLSDKISHLSKNECNDIEKLLSSYFAHFLSQGKPKTTSQQTAIFKNIPKGQSFKYYESNLLTAIGGGHQAIYWKDINKNNNNTNGQPKPPKKFGRLNADDIAKFITGDPNAKWDEQNGHTDNPIEDTTAEVVK